MKTRRILVTGLFVILTGARAFAEDTPKQGVRTAVPMSPMQSCPTPGQTIEQLAQTYYTKSTDDLLTDLGGILKNCAILRNTDQYVVIIFPGKPTKGAEDPTLLHIVLEVDAEKITEVGSFPGVQKATWLYLTDDATDVVRVQLVSTPGENPLVAQLGSLVSKAIGVFPGTANQPAPPPVAAGADKVKPPEIHYTIARDVALPFKRATIAQKDFVSVTVDKKPKQLDGELSVANVPKTWLTLHAGAGVLVGKLHGPTVAKIDDGVYVSDPLKRAATIVGAGFHAPFDSTTTEASPAEKWSFVVGAVITPAAGIFVGPSYGWRALGITVGYAWMWAPTPADGFGIGDDVKKPHEGGPDPQLPYRKVSAVMIGATYAFGK